MCISVQLAEFSVWTLLCNEHPDQVTEHYQPQKPLRLSSSNYAPFLLRINHYPDF